MLDTGQIILWMEKKPTTPFLLSILAHEIFHCTCFLMDRVGIKYSDDSDEAYAYMIQYLTTKCYEKLKITVK